MKSRVLVIAHSASAEDRARQLFSGRPGVDIASPGPGLAGGVRAASLVLARRPDALYLIDVGTTTSVATVAARAARIPVILDTGDLVYELERSRGARSRSSLAAVWLGERLALASARHVVVRGREHLAMLKDQNVTFAPDLAPDSARPVSGERVRQAIGAQDAFVVGLVGSINSAPRLGIAYGWDIIEALPATIEKVTALIVGDGHALPWLRRRAEELGIADRCHFAGRIPSDQVAEWIGAMDVAVSTQTNDPVGRVRTTGKLPLYLACGCPVLASDVGEARRLLGPIGWTIPYEGVVDRQYPARLAEVINRWACDGGTPARRNQARELFEQAFDPRQIRDEVWKVVENVLDNRS
jgi:glycosyltransferase involved in cell wall biosynthesis